MLDFHLSWPKLFRLPSKRRGFYASGDKAWYNGHKYGKLSEHKGWEIQWDHWGWDKILDLEIRLSLKGEDHAGFYFEFGLFGFSIMVNVYDSRHWDYDTNDWEIYDEENYTFRENKWEEARREQVEMAYLQVAEDVRKRDKIAAEETRRLWEESDEGKAELKRIAEEEVRKRAQAKADRKARGKEHKQRNLAKDASSS
jgi:hypothetical protein